MTSTVRIQIGRSDSTITSTIPALRAGQYGNMSIPTRLRADSAVASHCGDYTRKLSALLAELDHVAIEKVVRLFLEARDRGSRIIFIGNGGSASTASHFAIDIGIG